MCDDKYQCKTYLPNKYNRFATLPFKTGPLEYKLKKSKQSKRIRPNSPALCRQTDRP